MKKLFASFTIAILFLSSTGMALAAPWVPAEKRAFDDKFVAYYADGRHAIAGLGGEYYGRDLVMARGKSGNFQQWFEGVGPDGKYVGIHSVWNLAKKDCECPKDWVRIDNASAQWGDYLVEGATYCVHNNFYGPSK